MSKASKRSLRSLASLPSFTMGRKFMGHQIRKSRCLQSLVFFDRQASLRLKYVSGEAHQKESPKSGCASCPSCPCSPCNGPVAWETFCKKALLVWKAEINLSDHAIYDVFKRLCQKSKASGARTPLSSPSVGRLPRTAEATSSMRNRLFLEHLIHGSRCIAHHLHWRLGNNTKPGMSSELARQPPLPAN